MAELTIDAARDRGGAPQERRGVPADDRERAGRPGARGRRRHRARRGPARRRGQRAARVRGRRARPRAEPRRRRRSVRSCSARPTTSRRASSVTATGRILSIPVGDALLGRVVNALGVPIDGKGPIAQADVAPPRGAGARHHRPPAGARAAADRHQGHRRDDADRPGPARADHRRPQDRQDHRRHRHDPEPEGSGREVHLRRDRPEGLDGRADRRRRSREHGALEYTVVVSAPASDEAVFKYLAPYAGCAIGQHWMENGEARARRVRRPVEAGRGVPPDRRCCCGARRAARRTPATSSTSTAACSSAPRS